MWNDTVYQPVNLLVSQMKGSATILILLFLLRQQAWMQNTPLPIYFNGQNVLPTIHVLDLAKWET